MAGLPLQNVSAGKRYRYGGLLAKTFIGLEPFGGLKLQCEPLILRLHLLLLLSVGDERVEASPVRCRAFLRGS